MKPLFDIEKLHEYKYNDKLPFSCEKCMKTFYVEARWVKFKRTYETNRFLYCSSECHNLASVKKIESVCGQCQKSIKIYPKQITESKSGKVFCSRSCSTIYSNTHKTTGNRRSKLEIWLEQELTKRYPSLIMKYNDKTAINSELDIYIPSLNLAFELNGIFHYEPIYGQDKLSSTQNNDNRKFQACLEQQIELVIIDSSKEKYSIPKHFQKYLIIIADIINMKLTT